MINHSRAHHHFIDVLRIIAASIVVLFHLNEPFKNVDTNYAHIVKYGYLGVPIFFVISGYCIYLAANYSKNSIDFIVRRFFRILPAYWFSLIIVLSVAISHKLIISENKIEGIPHTFGDALNTIFLLTAPFSKTATMNWVYWSLTFELFFYCIVFVHLNVKQIIFYLSGVFTLIALLLNYSSYSFLFWIPHWFSFALGSSIFFLCNQKINLFLKLCYVAICYIGLAKYHFITDLPYFVMTMLTFLTILISFNWVKKSNAISNLGNYSYALYLIHVPLGVYIFGMFKSKFVLENSFLSLGFDLFVLIILTFISKHIYHFIEIPMINKGKSFIKKFTI